MTTPHVTVLMCVHNGARWLRPAVESILTQTWRDFEFLIIDDASTDETQRILASFTDARLRVTRQRENLGLTRSLNAGLRMARGSWIARQDADDLSHPDRLARQLAFSDLHPKIALLGTQGRLIDTNGRSRGIRDLPCSARNIAWYSLLDNPLIHSSAFFKKAVIYDELGGYDESFPCCQDYDLWVRVMEKHAVANLPERLVEIREHPSSVSILRRAEASLLTRRVMRRVADTQFSSAQLSDDDLALLADYRTHVAPHSLPVFHRLLERMDASLSANFPAQEKDAEWAAIHAAVSARVGYNLMTISRAHALRELVTALRQSPSIAFRLPWLRLAALFLLGDHARRLRAGSRVEGRLTSAGPSSTRI